jgi:hypothetical protein
VASRASVDDYTGGKPASASLKHEKEVEKDVQLIDRRHAAGGISEEKYRQLGEILAKVRVKDWVGAEARAYEFHSQCGDRGSFFK